MKHQKNYWDKKKNKEQMELTMAEEMKKINKGKGTWEMRERENLEN